MKPSGVITLITDFGLNDWYAGAMKGVLLGINPDAVIVDVTHGIDPGDLTGAALALKSSYRFFPPGTVHVVVVDPGVGSGRKILLAEWRRYFFLAPDNGILSCALGMGALGNARALERPAFWLRRMSSTFHGRDIMAPVAARLSQGVSPKRMGPVCRNPVRVEMPIPRRIGRRAARAEVIHVDRFGNLITNLEEGSPILSRRREIVIHIRGREIMGLSGSYQTAGVGALLALCGSSGYMEIAVCGGDASKELGAGRGTALTVKRIERGG
jgi:S-adenosylmethionine hydrolase